MTNSEIERRFENIIREEMTEKQFWDWVSAWMDVENIIDIATNWPIEEKEDLIKEFDEEMKKKKLKK